MWVLSAALLTLGGLVGGRWEHVGFVFVLCFVSRFVTLPLLTFVHELGHAATAARFTRRRALIQIGEEPFPVRFSIGPVDVEWSGRGDAAHCIRNRWVAISGRQLFLIVMAGPAASLLAAGCLGALAASLRDGPPLVFWCVAIGSAWGVITAVLNAVPFVHWPRWEGGVRWGTDQASDGWIALQVIKDRLWREALPGADESARRMTAGVERAVIAAGRAARVGPVGTQHLLAGLAREREGVAAQVLRDCGFRPVEGTRREDEPSSPATREFTPATLRALNRAESILTLRGDQSIDTEHVLLALIQEPGSSAVEALAEAGVDPAQVRQAALQALAPQHL
jgi:hypothetical protein